MTMVTAALTTASKYSIILGSGFAGIEVLSIITDNKMQTPKTPFLPFNPPFLKAVEQIWPPRRGLIVITHF